MPHSTRRRLKWAKAGAGEGGGGGGRRAVISSYKNIELGSAKKCTVNTVPCKVCLASPQLLEGRFGRM